MKSNSLLDCRFLSKSLMGKISMYFYKATVLSHKVVNIIAFFFISHKILVTLFVIYPTIKANSLLDVQIFK